jgi:ABC-type phosphate/phosphonate transport system substrate-binding protein
MASEDGSFGYEMEIITYPGSGIETVEDIKGKTWPSPPRPRTPASRRRPRS